MRMRRITLSSVAYPDLPYVSTLSHKRHDFRGEVIEHKMSVLLFVSIAFVTQHAMRMRRIILSSVAYPDLP
jgi:hypothetical protein